MIKNGERTRQFVLVISALGRLKQEDCQFEVSLGYIVRPSLQKEVLERDKEKCTSGVNWIPGSLTLVEKECEHPYQFLGSPCIFQFQ
jgi:hypothetical protein